LDEEVLVVKKIMTEYGAVNGLRIRERKILQLSRVEFVGFTRR
jgi:hypothetical protein